MRGHHLAVAVTCPACGANLDGALNSTGVNLPKAGDPGLCVYCRALLVYCGTPVVNSLRYPTSEEQRTFLADPAVQRVILALKQHHEQHGPIR